MKRGSRPRKTARTRRDESLSAEHSGRDYAVGYGKPPVASRFKTGISGNAQGRKKGSKNLKRLIKEIMTAKISIQEGPISRKVSKIEGVVMRQFQGALKGDSRCAMTSIKLAMLAGLLEDSGGTTADAAPLSAVDERILEELKSRHRKTR